MAHYLPPAIMAFFRPPPPLPFEEPIEKGKMKPYTGVAAFVEKFKEYEVNVPLPVKNKSPKEIRDERREKAALRMKKVLDKEVEKWNPQAEEEKKTGEAYKTVFVGRLPFTMTEDELKHEFEYYGDVVKVVIPKDKEGKSRGYAFVEFARSKAFSGMLFLYCCVVLSSLFSLFFFFFCTLSLSLLLLLLHSLSLSPSLSLSFFCFSLSLVLLLLLSSSPLFISLFRYPPNALSLSLSLSHTHTHSHTSPS